VRCPRALLFRWRERRETLRTLLADGDTDSWLWSLQLRILEFLLRRYDVGEPEPEGPEPIVSGVTPGRMRATFYVDAPEWHPTLPSASVRAVLDDIRGINEQVELAESRHRHRRR
jgi:hypothetical protein